MPTFSCGPATPSCSSCGYPSADIVDDAKQLVRAEHEGATDAELAIRLSANVGNYQTALMDGDRDAARAFLANVLAIGEILLQRGP